ncbi:MAG: hypothetical protein ACAH88_15910, partial [Roseimicrobium sp.]
MGTLRRVAMRSRSPSVSGEKAGQMGVRRSVVLLVSEGAGGAHRLAVGWVGMRGVEAQEQEDEQEQEQEQEQ